MLLKPEWTQMDLIGGCVDEASTYKYNSIFFLTKKGSTEMQKYSRSSSVIQEQSH